jgi:hypothetical protein
LAKSNPFPNWFEAPNASVEQKAVETVKRLDCFPVTLERHSPFLARVHHLYEAQPEI